MTPPRLTKALGISISAAIVACSGPPIPVGSAGPKQVQTRPSRHVDAGTVVADYFLGIIFPGEGAGNLGLYRQAAVNFLNDGSADSPSSTTSFALLSSTTANYDTRVRGMVAMLLTMQRFQEQ